MLQILDLYYKILINNVFSDFTKARKHSLPDYTPKLSYQKFKITNFKGIDEVEIDLVKNNLVLLLGLNESGKTTILKAIEAFSFLNDPSQDVNPNFFKIIRKKSDIGSNKPATITAVIKIEEELKVPSLKKLHKTELSEEQINGINGFLHHINKQKEVVISRVFPFKDGKPHRFFYRFESDHPFAQNELSSYLAMEIVNICPFIIYFEDFKDRIPERIYINKKSDSFDPIWYDIIDGLFYNTDNSFSISKFAKFYSKTNPMHDDASTVQTRVNKTLNDTFTTKWKDLSGVKEIDTTELDFIHSTSKQYFTLKVKDKDGTTYSVDERSKGALWYLSFLMKTEFRSKKLRKNFGTPVFLIDEPASNLHSTAQSNMIDDFKALAKDTCIIYTTHSQYLISLENIKNTYVIEKEDGIVKAHKWGVYLNKQDAQVHYYQPLANLLNIIPHSLDVPWKKCIITEGPTDRHVLLSIYRILYGKAPDFVIYPGNSAHNLSELISLNIGWNSDFKILLDSDDAGNTAGQKYIEMYNLTNEVYYLPSTNQKIEDCFTKVEKQSIRDMLLPDNAGNKVSKKEFAAMWGMLSESKEYDEHLKKILSHSSLSLFKTFFEHVNSAFIK